MHVARGINTDGVVAVVERLTAQRDALQHFTDGQRPVNSQRGLCATSVA